MGKMLLFLVIGMGGLFAVANLNMTYSEARLINSSVEQFETLQAKNIASSGIQLAISQLGQDTTWTGVTSLSIADGSLRVLVANTASQYPDGPNMGLSGMREVTSIGSFGIRTESSGGTLDTVSGKVHTIKAVIQIASAASVPPFLEYAVASENDLLLQGAFSVVDDGNPAWNANVHTNSNLLIQGGGYSVEGFGTYTGVMRKDRGGGSPANRFTPNQNPGGLATAYQSPAVSLPTFNPDDYIGIATQTYSGNQTKSGVINLGTKENPEIIYIDGDLDFHGTTVGYGVFIVTGTIYFHGNSSVSSSDPTGSNLAFYSQGGIDIHGNTTVYGQMYSEGAVVSHGNFDLYGSISSQSTMSLVGGGVVHYRPANADLTNQFWPTATVSRPQLISYYD